VEHRRGRLDNAVAAYQEALREDPSFFDAEQNLSAAHLEQDDLPQSLAASERALVLRPDSDPARLNFALALDRAGFPVDAAAEAQRIAERQPDDIAAHLLLGNLYAQKLNDPARARTHYLRVIELSPEHPESLAIRRWLANPR
jgi:superkiller protein 3